MRIYTRIGDDGTTGLYTPHGKACRVSKASARVSAYGTVDELNATLGELAALLPPRDEDIRTQVTSIQNALFLVGYDLATVPTEVEVPHKIEDSMVAELESWIDAFTAGLAPLRSFILPGGTSAAAKAHIARTVARRAERATVALAEAGAEFNREVLRYLNRLSDYLFTLARELNRRDQREEPAVRWS